MKIYERLDIKDLVDRGESFYQEMMGGTVKKLEDKGWLSISFMFILFFRQR